MNVIQRSYIYIVAFISLQVMGWAMIAMMRNLLNLPLDRTALAWQLALLIIGTPIFVGHWLWVQRSAAADREELEAPQRRFYLLAVMASLLGPFLAQAVFLLNDLLEYWRLSTVAWPKTTVRDTLSAMVVLAILWLFHARLWQGDERQVGESSLSATIRRLYQWGFTIAAFVIVTMAVTGLLARMFLQLLGNAQGTRPLISEISQLIVGVPLLIIFWWWNQRLFANNTSNEQQSLLRKGYLYLVLFVAIVATITNTAVLLASLLQTMWGIETGGELSDVLSLIVTFAAVWAAHLWLLKQDEKVAQEIQQQITIRQIYQYLSAAVGLLACLVGVGGVLSVLIRAAASETFTRTEVSWFIAAITAGLPLWLWFWRHIQGAAVAAESIEHESVVRRIYLYLFMLLATLTVLSAGVFIVYRLIAVALRLSVDRTAAVDLGHALAYGLLGLAIWLYHGRLIRLDNARQTAALASRLADIHVTVFNTADAQLDRAIVTELQRILPKIHLDSIAVSMTAVADPVEAKDIMLQKIRTADVIVTPWTMALNGLNGISQEILQAVVSNTASKIILPIPQSGWVWAGVDKWEPQQVAHDVAEQVEQLAASGAAYRRQRWGIGAVIAMGVGTVIVLAVVFNLIAAFLNM